MTKGAVVQKPVTEAFPRVPLYGAIALVVISLLVVAGSRYTGIGMARVQPAPVESFRDLRFTDREDGAIVVREAATGNLLEVLAPGTNGFIRGVLRGFVRDRRARALTIDPPFRVNRHADGRFSVEDPATGAHVALHPFGGPNADAFGNLLTAQVKTP